MSFLLLVRWAIAKQKVGSRIFSPCPPALGLSLCWGHSCHHLAPMAASSCGNCCSFSGNVTFPLNFPIVTKRPGTSNQINLKKVAISTHQIRPRSNYSLHERVKKQSHWSHIYVLPFVRDFQASTSITLKMSKWRYYSQPTPNLSL